MTAKPQPVYFTYIAPTDGDVVQLVAPEPATNYHVFNKTNGSSVGIFGNTGKPNITPAGGHAKPDPYLGARSQIQNPADGHLQVLDPSLLPLAHNPGAYAHTPPAPTNRSPPGVLRLVTCATAEKDHGGSPVNALGDHFSDELSDASPDDSQDSWLSEESPSAGSTLSDYTARFKRRGSRTGMAGDRARDRNRDPVRGRNDRKVPLINCKTPPEYNSERPKAWYRTGRIIGVDCLEDASLDGQILVILSMSSDDRAQCLALARNPDMTGEEADGFFDANMHVHVAKSQDPYVPDRARQVSIAIELKNPTWTLSNACYINCSQTWTLRRHVAVADLGQVSKDRILPLLTRYRRIVTDQLIRGLKEAGIDPSSFGNAG